MEILIKILQISLIWLFLFGFYHFFLRKETFFNTNRFFLLLALGLGLIFPFVLPAIKGLFEENVTTLPTYVVTLGELDFTSEEVITSASWHWSTYILIGYAIGLIAFMGRFLQSFYKIIQLKRTGQVQSFERYQLIRNNQIETPFSFGKWLFLPQNTNISSEDEAKIIEHELVHIHARHTFDIILVEALTILFWFNPLLQFFQNALREVHEYAADKVVLRSIPVKNYGQLLLQQAFPNVELNLVHTFTFNQSQLKKRIKMMTKKKSSKQASAKYLLAAPLLAVIFVVFSAFQKAPINMVSPFSDQEVTLTANDILSEKNDPIYTKVDKMPYLKGCVNEDNINCTHMKLVNDTYSNIKYPITARKNGIDGLVVVSFVVNKEGEMTNISLVKDVADDGSDIIYKKGINTSPEKTSSGLGEAGMAAVLKMTKNKNEWVAGVHQGKNVSVEFKLPIRFKLSSE